MTADRNILAGRYRLAAPLPTLGGVPRDLAVDTVADGQVEIARCARSGAVPAAFGALAARLQAVRHPCLAPILAWTEPGADTTLPPILVEQHVDGARLGGSVTLPRRQALLAIADVADALGALHAAGLVHGGLAADAIVIDPAGRAIVCGAGLAQLQATALAEQGGAGDPADDLRALGAVLYALLTGQPPAVPAAPPASVAPDVEPALNGLTLSLLETDPDRPPPPAAAVSLRLRELAGEPVIEAGPVPAARPPRTLRTSRPSRTPLRTLRALPAPRSDVGLLAIAGLIALAGIVSALAVSQDGTAKTENARTITIRATLTAAGLPTAPQPTETVYETTAETIYETIPGPGTTAIQTIYTYPGTTVLTVQPVTTTLTHTGATTLAIPVTVTVPAR